MFEHLLPQTLRVAKAVKKSTLLIHPLSAIALSSTALSTVSLANSASRSGAPSLTSGIIPPQALRWSSSTSGTSPSTVAIAQNSSSDSKEEKKKDKPSSRLDFALKAGSLLIGSYGLFKLVQEEIKTEDAKREAEQVQQISNLPPRTPNYVRPEALWQQLKDAFTAYQSDSNVATIEITGVTGAGKSELVKAFLADSIARAPSSVRRKNFTTVIWLDASSVQTLEDSYLKLARDAFNIDVRESAENAGRDKQRIIQEFNRHLAQRPGWVLVFDNINESCTEAAKAYIPADEHQRKGKVVLVAREAVNILAKHKIRVTGLAHKEATELLRNMAGKREEAATQQQLLEKIAFLPFAIELAGRLIREQRLTFAEYLNLYNAQALSPINGGFYTDKDSVGIYQTVFGITVNSLWQDKELQPFLQTIAFLAPGEPIAYFLFDTISTGEKTQAVLGKLARYGLLKQGDITPNIRPLSDAPEIYQSRTQLRAKIAEQKKKSDDSLWTLWIHAAIPELLQNKLGLTSHNNQLARTVLASCINDENQLISRLASNELLIPHFDYWLQHILNTASAEDVMLAARMRCAIASYHLQIGRPYVAKKYIEKAKTSLDELIMLPAGAALDAKEICRRLIALDTPNSSAYPTVYAHTHYFFGRLYSYLQDDEILSLSENWFDVAIGMRAEIDAAQSAEAKIYDDRMNKHGMFTDVYVRSGKVLLLLIKAEYLLNKNQADGSVNSILQNAEGLFKQLLIREEQRTKKDYFHQSVCYDLWAKMNLLKAKQSSNASHRQELFAEALAKSNTAISLATSNNYTKEVAKFSCVLGRTYLERGQKADLAHAEQAFLTVVNTFKFADFPLAEAYENLARIHRAHNDLEEASKNIKRSLQVQFFMGRLDSHPTFRKTQELQQLIEMELADRQESTVAAANFSMR